MVAPHFSQVKVTIAFSFLLSSCDNAKIAFSQGLGGQRLAISFQQKKKNNSNSGYRK